jgi:hypothetical protein
MSRTKWATHGSIRPDGHRLKPVILLHIGFLLKFDVLTALDSDLCGEHFNSCSHYKPAANASRGTRHNSTLNITGQFALGTDGTAFDPASDIFSLQLGTYSVSIPAGSFATTATGSFSHSRTISGHIVSVNLKPSSTGYAFSVEAKAVDVATIVNPATLQLVVGCNTGSAAVIVKPR